MLTPVRNSLRIPNCATHTSMLCVHMQPGVVTRHTVKGGSTHTHTHRTGALCRLQGYLPVASGVSVSLHVYPESGAA